MTIEGSESVEQQVRSLRSELRSLKKDFDTLSRRVLSLERSGPRLDDLELDAGLAVTGPTKDGSVWSLVGESQLLPRVAMVCFALVLALVLRTLADSAVIDRQLGVLLGIGYAASLIGIGARLLSRGRRGRRVLPVCGILLLCTVLIESQGSTGTLSIATANWILLVAMAVTAAIGLRFGAGSILAFTALSTSVTALAMGFPHPDFPRAAAVILAGNVVASLARRVQGMAWLQWMQLAVTVGLWLIWGFQAHADLRQPDAVRADLGIAWYLPFAVAFALWFVAVSARRAFLGRSDTFDVFVPTANVVWAYAAVLAVVTPTDGVGALAAWGGGIALAHFALAAWLSKRSGAGAAAVTGFTLAGTVLFALTTPSILGSFALALPLWSALAVGLIQFSIRTNGTALRVASFLLQALVCILAVATDAFAVPGEPLTTDAGAATAIALLAALHYRLARTHPPEAGTWLARLDRGNHAPVAMFWIAAVAAFGALRLVAFELVAVLGVEDTENMFLGAQSVIVNLASIALMLWGIRSRRGEILATAVLVAVFGGMRLIGSDLLGGHGVPLVLSVASFGAAAAVGSIVLGRWLGQRAPSSAG